MNTLADFQPLKPAEQKLLECCQSGEETIIAKVRPTEKTEENAIRAEFLRWLILFSKIEIDPIGIQLQGAWIHGTLYLNHTQCLCALGFWECVFEETLWLMRATTKSIHTDGSLFQQGIQADGLICQGSLHLRNGFCSEGEVNLLGIKIEGNFDCTNATFKASKERPKALSCDSFNVYGSVVLRNSYIEGEVRFIGAKIRRNFSCINTNFQGFNGEEVTLNCDSIDVRGGMFFRDNCKIMNGNLDLTNATVSSISDGENFWKQETLKGVYINGFKYEHIHGSTSASFRLKNMLGKMPEFMPQPYRQLAKVLRNMGHDRDADEVMIALHDKKLELSKESWWYKAFRKLYKWTSEYGYRPMRTLKIMASIWFLFGCIYWYGANVAVFAPSSPLIFQNKEYNCSVNVDGTTWSKALPKYYNALNNWYIASPAEYTTFQPFWYSLDIILPVVDLKMENDWGIVIPSPEGNWTDMIPFTTTNHFIRFLTWVESLAGWGLSLMLVAILSGLAKNEKE